MARATISDKAESDLTEIWKYIALDNFEQANKFVDEFFALFQTLAENSKSGRLRDDLFANLRTFPHKRYVVYYFPMEYGIDVFRVLHSARDVDEIFD